MADTRTIPDDLTDDQISELATESGFGFFGKWQLYQGNRDELLRFARAILARSTVRAPVDASAQEAAPQRGGWQTMETAPKDGTVVLCLWFSAASVLPVTSRNYALAMFEYGQWCSAEDIDTTYDDPDLWQPLPPPPASLQQHDQQEGAA